MDVYRLYENENEYADMDWEKCAEHLAGYIRCVTVSYIDPEKTDYREFDKLHELIRQNYPHIMKKAEYQEIGHNILIKIPGTDSSLKPAMFIAHQDVVPVTPNTEKEWTYPPYSGEIADGFIFGRGSLDIKGMLAGFLESAEYLLAHGHLFRRTVYLAFGEDEEVKNTGSKTMGQYLKSQGIELEYVWDESGRIRDGACYGAPGIVIGEIGMYEKGYADLSFTAHAAGGHSSMPFYGTSLGKLADAISAVTGNPLPAVLPQSCRDALRALKPYITAEPLLTYVQDIDTYREEIIAYYRQNKDLFNLVQTTAAPTMITEGAAAGNVMPGDMRAVINFRLIPEDTVEKLLAHCREVVDPKIEVDTVQAINASKPGNHKSYGFEQLVSSLNHFFPEIRFIPSANATSTDSHNYECICGCCMRFTPFVQEPELIDSGIHGSDERLFLRAYKQGIRTMIRMIETTC